MKRTTILAVLLLFLVAAAYASDMKTEICPICLFPHGTEAHQVTISDSPTMYPPVAVPYAVQSTLETVHDEDINLTFSLGATSGKLSWVYWLDCMAPTGLEKNSWIIDARAGLSFRKMELFSIGFEAGTLLYLDGKGSVDAYDIPLMLEMAIVPEAGIIGFPIRLGIGILTGFSPITRDVFHSERQWTRLWAFSCASESISRWASIRRSRRS